MGTGSRPGRRRVCCAHLDSIFKQRTHQNLPRREAPGAMRLVSPPRKLRGRRKRRAPEAPAIRVQKMHTVDHRYPARPAFPARWLYGLWRAPPGDEFVFVTVAGGLTVLQNPVGPQKTSAG